MHPIERLRYVARSSGASQETLVRETAGALAALGFDPPGLVTACRRILDRHPLSGPLWWLSARVLTSNDSNNEAWHAADDITADDTGDVLAYNLPDDSVVCVLGWPDVIGDALPRRGDVAVLVVDALGEGSGFVRRLLHSEVDADDVPMSGLGAAVADADLVLLEASAIGPTGFVGVAGSRAAAATAKHAGVPVWVVGGVGRLLPARMWGALASRLDAMGEPWELDDELVPIELVDRIAMPTGILEVPDALRHTDCPIAPELFKSIDPL
ncbi:MAG TPA: hypothetical protein VGZ52_02215 [Acidimicrobiales bacterium]|nr:hypothetical protein [Acidimicrobiales bacterium]